MLHPTYCAQVYKFSVSSVTSRSAGRAIEAYKTGEFPTPLWGRAAILGYRAYLPTPQYRGYEKVPCIPAGAPRSRPSV